MMLVKPGSTKQDTTSKVLLFGLIFCAVTAFPTPSFSFVNSGQMNGAGGATKIAVFGYLNSLGSPDSSPTGDDDPTDAPTLSLIQAVTKYLDSVGSGSATPSTESVDTVMAYLNALASKDAGTTSLTSAGEVVKPSPTTPPVSSLSSGSVAPASPSLDDKPLPPVDRPIPPLTKPAAETPTPVPAAPTRPYLISGPKPNDITSPISPARVTNPNAMSPRRAPKSSGSGLTSSRGLSTPTQPSPLQFFDSIEPARPASVSASTPVVRKTPPISPASLSSSTVPAASTASYLASRPKPQDVATVQKTNKTPSKLSRQRPTSSPSSTSTPSSSDQYLDSVASGRPALGSARAPAAAITPPISPGSTRPYLVSGSEANVQKAVKTSRTSSAVPSGQNPEPMSSLTSAPKPSKSGLNSPRDSTSPSTPAPSSLASGNPADVL